MRAKLGRAAVQCPPLAGAPDHRPRPAEVARFHGPVHAARIGHAGPLLLLRRRFKAAPETAGISIGDLVVFCAIQALLEVPT